MAAEAGGAEYHHQRQRDDKKEERDEHHAAAGPGSGSDGEEVGAAAAAADIISERALLRKLDWRLLPAVGILYLLSFLDRSNVANARIEGLATDLGMSE